MIKNAVICRNEYELKLLYTHKLFCIINLYTAYTLNKIICFIKIIQFLQLLNNICIEFINRNISTIYHSKSLLLYFYYYYRTHTKFSNFLQMQTIYVYVHIHVHMYMFKNLFFTNITYLYSCIFYNCTFLFEANKN